MERLNPQASVLCPTHPLGVRTNVLTAPICAASFPKLWRYGITADLWGTVTFSPTTSGLASDQVGNVEMSGRSKAS